MTLKNNELNSKLNTFLKTKKIFSVKTISLKSY